jgi:hypothetical protein
MLYLVGTLLVTILFNVSWNEALAIRLFVSFESTAFVTAALILTNGYEHPKAGVAENVIAVVLLVGLALTWMRPRASRRIGLAAQGFALYPGRDVHDRDRRRSSYRA